MDWDRAYANADFIPEGAEYPARWAAAAKAFRAGAKARLDLPYGDGPRNRFDLFLPEGTPKGLVLFIHGGYWMAFGREIWSHLAAGPLAHGWAVAMPSYTLAPEARIAQMTAEIAAALTAAAAEVAGPIVLAGHSAGGHLTARMVCTDVALPDAVAARIRRAVPISPLADLEQIALTGMNRTLHLDAAEVASESPARLPRRPGPEVLVWVGGQERPAFLWQARLLSEAWDCPWHVAPGRHHFDVIAPLSEPDSDLTRALIA